MHDAVGKEDTLSRPAKPPFIAQTTGDPYLDLSAAMVGQAIDDLLDPLHGSARGHSWHTIRLREP